MKNEEIKTTSPKPATDQFLFAGGGEYEPITIEASTIEEATEIWKTKKVKTLTT